MRYFVRWWETLGRAERIVALSLGLGAPVAVINSTVWAVAVAYMAHERSRVEIERFRAETRPLSTSGDRESEFDEPADAQRRVAHRSANSLAH